MRSTVLKPAVLDPPIKISFDDLDCAQMVLRAWLEKLESMGTEDIARLLRAEGIQGMRGSTTDCPVARLLCRKSGIAVRVNTGRILAGSMTYDTPLSVGRFVEQFDTQWAWPELCQRHHVVFHFPGYESVVALMA